MSRKLRLVTCAICKEQFGTVGLQKTCGRECANELRRMTQVQRREEQIQMMINDEGTPEELAEQRAVAEQVLKEIHGKKIKKAYESNPEKWQKARVFKMPVECASEDIMLEIGDRIVIDDTLVPISKGLKLGVILDNKTIWYALEDVAIPKGKPFAYVVKSEPKTIYYAKTKPVIKALTPLAPSE